VNLQNAKRWWVLTLINYTCLTDRGMERFWAGVCLYTVITLRVLNSHTQHTQWPSLDRQDTRTRDQCDITHLVFVSATHCLLRQSPNRWLSNVRPAIQYNASTRACEDRARFLACNLTGCVHYTNPTDLSQTNHAIAINICASFFSRLVRERPIDTYPIFANIRSIIVSGWESVGAPIRRCRLRHHRLGRDPHGPGPGGRAADRPTRRPQITRGQDDSPTTTTTTRRTRRTSCVGRWRGWTAVDIGMFDGWHAQLIQDLDLVAVCGVADWTWAEGGRGTGGGTGRERGPAGRRCVSLSPTSDCSDRISNLFYYCVLVRVKQMNVHSAMLIHIHIYIYIYY